MSEKIEVKICVGTTCYVMGASDILAIEDELDAKTRDRINFIASPCLNMCITSNQKKPPYVIIDGEIISNANASQIKTKIKQLVC